MIIFKDIITDDEMISDSYDLKEVDGIVYEADCAMIEEGGVEVGPFAFASAAPSICLQAPRMLMLQL